MTRDIRDSMFPDQQQTEEYLKTLSPRTVRKFWKFVLHDDLRKYPGYAPRPFEHMRISNAGVLTARIFKLSQKWDKGSLDPSKFRIAILHIASFDCIEIFEKLPSETQQKIWVDLYSNGISIPCVERGYLELVHRTALTADFCDTVYDDNLDPKIVTLESTAEAPSDKFMKVFLAAFPPRVIQAGYHFIDQKEKRLFQFGNYSTKSMMMLKELYGEDSVIEMFQRFMAEEVMICLNEAITVLDCWNEIRDYPAQWIAASNGFEHYEKTVEVN